MASICDINLQKPDIKYPLFWEYKVIFNKSDYSKDIIDEVLKGNNYKISYSKHSSTGKYISFNIDVFVNSKDHRDEIFSCLKKHAKFVL